MRAERNVKGFALLEAIVAIIIVGTALLAVTAMLSQSSSAVQTALRAEALTTSASSALSRAAALNRGELEQRIGVSPLGRWLLTVDRPTPTVFELAVLDTATQRPFLRTAVYRPEGTYAP